MEKYVIRGGKPLVGDVNIGGAKNAAVAILPATILAGGKCLIENLPCISDVMASLQILSELGASIRMVSRSTYEIDTSHLDSTEVSNELSRQMRASYYFLGALLGRFGSGQVAMPGGCQIGARPIDMHLVGLEALGVKFEIRHGFLHATTPEGLHGADIVLDFPSVGATENMLMASVVAEGRTLIENAAREPEIVDLADMLNSMGARVTGAGTSIIEVEGVPFDELHPCEHTTVGDRIEAGTFLVGGALTGGPVTVRGIDPSYLRMALMKLTAMGCDVEHGEDWITVSRTRALTPTDIQTLPHPGFPTDLQAQFMLLAALADGTSVITENVFENRFMFASELARMGADISIEDHHALVEGVPSLQGADVSSTDLRAGAALVLAGIVAEGETRVHNLKHIDRGYEDYVGKLRGLGATIDRRAVDGDR